MKKQKVIRTHALIFAGLVPSAPPTIEMLFSLTSDVNLYIKQTYKHISIKLTG